MEEIALSIYNTVKDYRNHDGIQIDTQYILNWAAQFGQDAEFILNELNHLLPQVYTSRDQAKEYIKGHIDNYLKQYNYTSISTFLTDTQFLNLQLAHKSQSAILILLEEVLSEQFGESYLNYITYPKKIFIYFDDILASGSTIGKHLVEWLTKIEVGKPNQDRVFNDEARISVSLFCCHRWGLAFQQYRISKTFSDKLSNKISWWWNYEVQNHGRFNNQSLNVAKPVKGSDLSINNYFASLVATKYEDYAFRDVNSPAKETFFSSPENRIRFENIITRKGIEIIGMIKGTASTNIRPLGLINPDYKILGLGTHFFTWRNIPNNSPLVYWWEVPGHNWIPLFPVANRGN